MEEVGRGGMAVVYRGMDNLLKREVAIKVLHPHLADHAEARRRLEREAQAVAKLQHRNIIEIYDYSAGNGTDGAFIVTEFISGRTLKDVIAWRTFPFPEIGAMVVAEVCRALAHAHSSSVLHRDIKPENIMVRDDGTIKLTDFGIAQIFDNQRLTVTGQLLGSPAYMAPEQIEGKPLDFRTDVFSTSVLLYQLATGELPFAGRNTHEVLRRICECKVTDVRLLNPLVGARLARIINKGLARDPVDRYPGITPLLDDLLRYLGEAELEEPAKELASFFSQPVTFEQALRQRLIAGLSRRGKAELQAKRSTVALELYNRVLTIDPSNEQVLQELGRLAKRRWLAASVWICVLFAVAACTVAFVAWRPSRDARQGPAMLAPAIANATAAARSHRSLPMANSPTETRETSAGSSTHDGAGADSPRPLSSTPSARSPQESASNEPSLDSGIPAKGPDSPHPPTVTSTQVQTSASTFASTPGSNPTSHLTPTGTPTPAATPAATPTATKSTGAVAVMTAGASSAANGVENPASPGSLPSERPRERPGEQPGERNAPTDPPTGIDSRSAIARVESASSGARTFRFFPNPKNIYYSLDGAPLRQVLRGSLVLQLDPGPHTVLFKHERCEDWVVELSAEEKPNTITGRCRFKPTRIVPHCPQADAVLVNNRSVASDSPIELTNDDFDRDGRYVATIEFSVNGRVQSVSTTAIAGQRPVLVKCASPVP
ncbi:MAG: protein kinase [Pseudomonadota bacterium]